jgi:hypothetical protein|uniref:Uncharacterized protein n=1 Tax=viral metagenome TaxID=1070528 RepID=A0A6C0LJA1_9ZZZZ
MDTLIKQAPANMTIEEIEIIYNKNNKDQVKTLLELWDVQEKAEAIISEETQKWNDIRDTCDLYDIEMQKIISKKK